MRYSGEVEFAHARSVREWNKPAYRLAHWPIWIWVFFLFPGPLTFRLFARGLGWPNLAWLAAVLAGTGVAGVRGQLPGVEPQPYILRFDEDRPNPLYRRVCYTFAWSALLSFAAINLVALLAATVTGQWRTKRIYQWMYAPVCGGILLAGVAGLLPRAGFSTRGEGTERRYFYTAVWSVTAAQTLLLIAWKAMPLNRRTTAMKLGLFAGTLLAMGAAGLRGMLPRTRPIVTGELMVG